MRGALDLSGLLADNRRIIPAYAGSTVYRRLLAGSRRDHPRVCGEHLIIIARPVRTWGSSPRMRGAHTR